MKLVVDMNLSTDWVPALQSVLHGKQLEEGAIITLKDERVRVRSIGNNWEC